VRTLDPLTASQLARAESALLRPAKGSLSEAAALHGVDLTLLVEQLRLTPAERAAKLEDASTALESIRGIARRRC
jgi:hypothetical protein